MFRRLLRGFAPQPPDEEPSTKGRPYQPLFEPGEREASEEDMWEPSPPPQVAVRLPPPAVVAPPASPETPLAERPVPAAAVEPAAVEPATVEPATVEKIAEPPEPAVVKAAAEVAAEVEGEELEPAVVGAGEPVGGIVASNSVGQAELRLVMSVMRASPDARYRAARSLDLLEGRADSRGMLAFERDLLERARAGGKLAALSGALQR